MKNCYIWAKEQIASHGGELVVAWSSRWFGHFHIIHVANEGSLTGYGPNDKSYVTLWRFLWDGEWVFEGHTEEYKDYIPFMDGLKAAMRMELMRVGGAVRALAANLWVRLSWPL